MCGLVAIYKRDESSLDFATLESMVETLHHRGPDDHGFGFAGPDTTSLWREERPAEIRSGGVAMGHRRLSILDLSQAGRQPFVDESRRFWLVYNGEVYNYLELRKELVAFGYRFRTQTDTEVILRAFQHWGPDCFRRFNGMWALVVWDNETRTLVASRDRFGIKPLFYRALGDDWLFASEVKSLLACPGVARAPNDRSLARYLRRFAPPLPGESFFDGVHTVRPGTYLTLTDGRLGKHRYWGFPAVDAPISDLAGSSERLSELLTDAVRLRMRSDVRVGTMLSGGLDSTTIIRKMVELRASGAGAREVMGDTLQAFTASFPGMPNDESARVEDVRQMLKLVAHTVYPHEEDDVEALFDSALYHMEAPFMNAVPMVHTLLMRKARSVGVKVVLNGHGADEVFAGYPETYLGPTAADYLRRFRWTLGLGLILGMTRREETRGHHAVRQTLDHLLPYRLTFWNRPRDDTRLSSLFRDDPRARPPSVELPPGRSALDRLLKRDFSLDVLPSWLDLEDRISMSASIEARVPFLDYRVVELGFSLDDSLKIRDGATKFLLRTAMASHLPPSIIDERRKFRFSGPDHAWMTGPLRPMVESALLDPGARLAELLDPVAVKEELARFFNGDRRRTRQLWTIFNTEMWLRRFC